MNLLLYTTQSAPRVRYACKVLFGHILGLQVEVTADWSRFQSANADKIIYGAVGAVGKEPCLPASSLLFEKGIHPQRVDIRYFEGRPAGFFVPGKANALLPFDLLAFTFYLAARYEEYLPFEGDAHGRFPATGSLAHQHGFLQQPVLQEWGGVLLKRLQAFYPHLPDRRPGYTFRPTYDVDRAWAYRHRSLWLQLGGWLKAALQGNRTLLRERLRVCLGRARDPFYTFDELEILHTELGLRPLFFLLLGRFGTYDKNLPPRSKAMQALAQELSARGDTGLHPSYRSNISQAQLQAEVGHYTRLTGQAPLRSRQHFLKLSFPATYRQLTEAGIKEDYTMGYADAPGFRAGLSVPYPWYDLEAEAEQPLLIHPFAVMDVTLQQYLKLSPGQAIEMLKNLVDTVWGTGGVFMPLWHNSSFAASHGWAGWAEVHEALLRYGSTKS
jgi:hypothetical protein